MPQLLIEFFSEEIPARMQGRAAEDLLRLLEVQLKEAGLKGEAAKAFAGPRRLAVMIDGLPARTPDLKEERKGPRVGAPEQALAGFLKAAGLASIDEAVVQDDPKGAFYVARIDKPGRDTADILAAALPAVAKSFPWPKSMRSGISDFYWVRPLQSVVAIFDGKIVECEIGGIKAGRLTRGHRFHAPSSFDVSNFEDYSAKLRASWVVLDAADRKALIVERAKKLCADANLEMVDDPGLLDEVCGLVEWPVPVLGKMDPAFLDLPAEVIRLSMRTHQKYFAVRDPKTGSLAPNFITVANIDAVDGGKAIAAGNARVLSARLNDARFFWDGDRKTPLFTEERKAKLEKIVFHQKLGSVWDKVERVRALAKELCAVTGADPELVDRAALLSKCDLVTEVVGEFPELQGQIGRQLYLAEIERDALPPLDGEGGARSAPGGVTNKDTPSVGFADSSPIKGEQGAYSVALAIEDHYRPLGPNDRVPTDKVAVTLALADKIDTLVGFWAIDEKPTGSKDPFALRRAALGLNAIVLNAGLRLSLRKAVLDAVEVGLKNDMRAMHALSKFSGTPAEAHELLQKFGIPHIRSFDSASGVTSGVMVDPMTFKYAFFTKVRWQEANSAARCFGNEFSPSDKDDDLVAFFADRLKVQLRDQGKRHDLVDAALTPAGKLDDDLVRIVARVEALEAFLKTDDGVNLLAGYKRAVNILKAEEKKEAGLAAELASLLNALPSLEGEGGRAAAGWGDDSPPQSALRADSSSIQGEQGASSAPEKALVSALASAETKSAAALLTEDFAGAMSALAGLRQPVDAFFEQVLVNDPDPMLRRSKLLLLFRVRAALERVADFSQIEG